MRKISCIILAIALFTTACSVKTRRTIEEEQQPPTVEPEVVPVDEREDTVPGYKGPKVGIILGPGGVRSFAHTGVIKELQKANVPIDAVVGIEWGALVGALFAQNGKIHEAEWKLYKLQKKEIPGRSFLSKKFQAESIEKMSPYFKKTFENMQVDAMRLNFACPSFSIWNGKMRWQNRGQLSQAVSRCLPYPPIFKPKDPWMAAAFSVKSAVQYLKDQKIDVVILVNVLSDGDLLEKKDSLEEFQAAILWQEVRREMKESQSLATEVINVSTKGYKLFDFDHRRSIVVAGERAGKREASRIADKYGF